MTVSVVIPVHNAAAELGHCLESILSQDGPELEILCVDDGSTDASVGVLEGYARRDQRLKILRQPNSGAGPARNLGLDHATGRYVLFFDDDDWCEPGFFRKLAERAEDADADIVIPAIRWIDGDDGSVSSVELPQGISLDRTYSAADLGEAVFTFSHAASYKLFRREFVLANRLRFQSLPRKNDVLFVNLALACASRIAVARDAFYNYVYNSSGAIHTRWAESPTAFSDAFGALWRELKVRKMHMRLRSALLRRIVIGGRDELGCLRGHRLPRLKARIAYYRLLARVGGVSAVLSEIYGSLVRKCGQVKSAIQRIKTSPSCLRILERKDFILYGAWCARRRLLRSVFGFGEVRGARCAVHVCMICDANYLMPTCVAIASMRRTRRPGTVCAVHVICRSLPNEGLSRLRNLQSEDFIVDIVDDVPMPLDENRINVERHVTTTALVKFCIPDIFPELDRILYLDGDILVQGDLNELWHSDLQGHLAGVVKDTMTVCGKDGHIARLGLPCPVYFNSGVLLLDLRLMRRRGVPRRLIHYRLMGRNHFMDQDAFNAVFGSDVVYLPLRYNCLNCYFDYLCRSDLERLFGEALPEDRTEVFRSAVILHLGGREKPWRQKMEFLTEHYRKEAERIGWNVMPE